MSSEASVEHRRGYTRRKCNPGASKQATPTFWPKVHTTPAFGCWTAKGKELLSITARAHLCSEPAPHFTQFLTLAKHDR